MQLPHPSLSVPQQHTCLIVIWQASLHLRVPDIDFGDKIHSRTSSQPLSVLCILLIDSPRPNLLKSYCEVLLKVYLLPVCAVWIISVMASSFLVDFVD